MDVVSCDHANEFRKDTLAGLPIAECLLKGITDLSLACVVSNLKGVATVTKRLTVNEERTTVVRNVSNIAFLFLPLGLCFMRSSKLIK